MSHKHVGLPLPMKPVAQLSRFLFKTGKGDWVYRLLGFAATRMDRGHGRVNVFKGYVPTKNDVVVACLSRSGTHWLLQIVLQIANLGQAEYDYLYDVIAWPDFLPGVSIKLTDPPPKSPTGLRVIKTHSAAEMVPVNDNAKYVSIIRDPKEVLVSLYHFVPQAFAFLGIETGSPEEWVRRFLHHQVPGGWWPQHTASWWALREKPNVHITTFNDLKADPGMEIDRISTFLGVEITAEQRRQVLEKSSFEYMKAISHKFAPVIDNKDTIHVVRKGRVGTGGELFTHEQLARIDSFCKSELVRLGSDFPYDQLFA